MDIMKVSENKNALEIVVEGLIQETHELLSKTINATKAADEERKQQRVNWTDRHRLHVLLEAAEDTRRDLPNAVVAPWFLAELRTTLDVVRRWREKPSWKEIEPSLRTPTHFKHTILKFHVAEHLEKAGHKVEIVPRGESASPDLVLRAIGGTQDCVYVECYQPNALCGRVSDISAKGAKNIVKTSMKKVKRQLDRKSPGILAICGYNQSNRSLATLRQAVIYRLQKTSFPNLCGFWLMMLGIVLRIDKNNMSFAPTISANFIPNPSYFGRVSIEAKVPDDHPQLIKEPLIDIISDSLLSGDINLITSLMTTSNVEPAPVKEARGRVMRELNIIEKPKQLSRTVVHGAGNNVPPLFEGEGNIDYLCGQCGAILAKHVWELSISNVVVECPTCRTYNEFSPLPDSDFDRFQLRRGNYNFSDAVILRRGMYIKGQ